MNEPVYNAGVFLSPQNSHSWGVRILRDIWILYDIYIYIHYIYLLYVYYIMYFILYIIYVIYEITINIAFFNTISCTRNVSTCSSEEVTLLLRSFPWWSVCGLFTYMKGETMATFTRGNGLVYKYSRHMEHLGFSSWRSKSYTNNQDYCMFIYCKESV